MKNKKRNLESPESDPRLGERADDRTLDLDNEFEDPAAVLALEEEQIDAEDIDTVSLDTLRYISHLPCHYEYCFVPGPTIEQ